MRDTADAGAFEFWGVGVNNSVHHNCVADMDPGNLDGSWMNFMFQDDASHYLNFSHNIVFEVCLFSLGLVDSGFVVVVSSVSLSS